MMERKTALKIIFLPSCLCIEVKSQINVSKVVILVIPGRKEVEEGANNMRFSGGTKSITLLHLLSSSLHLSPPTPLPTIPLRFMIKQPSFS
jgi:hypothetical protein